MKNLINKAMRNLVNIPGKGVGKRKILVIESDDWGSTRTRSRKDRDALEKAGFKFEGYPYYQFNRYDTLETNSDLEGLFEVLSNHKDIRGNSAVFTLVSNVANPNFERIKKNGYSEYLWEPLSDTLEKYGEKHNRVYALHKEGFAKKLIYPVFHGREHLNVQKWLRYLQQGNKSVLTEFEYGSCNYYLGIDNVPLGNMPAAFDLEFASDLEYQHSVIKSGLDEFERLWGFKSKYFVPPNGPYNSSLDKYLAESGVRYILGERVQNEPQGDGRFITRQHWIGNKNKQNLTYLNRFGFFEPSYIDNPIEHALLAVERAFRWNKPAILSSHRVNYCGYISPQNRDNGLHKLDEFLSRIKKRWSDVEFMTSIEVGDLLKRNNIDE